jgi:hypothetical protein
LAKSDRTDGLEELRVVHQVVCDEVAARQAERAAPQRIPVAQHGDVGGAAADVEDQCQGAGELPTRALEVLEVLGRRSAF